MNVGSEALSAGTVADARRTPRNRRARALSRTRGLAGFTWLYVAWSLVPVVIAVAFSFNGGRSRSVWQGFSTQWWVGGGDSVLHNPAYGRALMQSFLLATLAVAIAVPLGVALAVFLSRWRGRATGPLNVLAAVPLVVPELVIAIALFILLTHFGSVFRLGTAAQVVGQVTLSLPFVVAIVRARLATVSTHLEDAAMDLGARPAQTLRLVVVPLLYPAIVASAIVTFALSIDNFVITQYLSSDESTQTVPILIYNTARVAATPALNAAATLLVVVTFVLVALGAGAYAWLARRQTNNKVANESLLLISSPGES